MSEKRFTLTDWHEVKDNGNIMTVDEVVGKLNEQQATINKYKENWDDLVELATKTSLRNVELDEQIGQLRKELNELDIENNYLKIHKDKFERKYLETMLENKSLKKDMENKKELISNLESKVIRQKGQLRNLNKSKFKIILDFCNWLREQGAEYETINYGDDADIAEMINEYLKEEGD